MARANQEIVHIFICFVKIKLFPTGYLGSLSTLTYHQHHLSPFLSFSLPFIKTWREKIDKTSQRFLILQFTSKDARTTFICIWVILHPLELIYQNENLTKMSVAHRRSCVPKMYQAKRERTTYQNGQVIIDGKPTI